MDSIKHPSGKKDAVSGLIYELLEMLLLGSWNVRWTLSLKAASGKSLREAPVIPGVLSCLGRLRDIAGYTVQNDAN